jgi:hypothetical protein
MAIIMCGNGACTTEIKNSYQPCANPIESWTSCVVATGERNGYHDSDFYAIVWDDETQLPKTIEYATTRSWTYHNHASVDASPEIMAKYNAHKALLRAKYEALKAEQAAQQAIEDAKKPAVGKEVRSLTIRGKNKGVIGLVRRIQPGSYPNRNEVAVIEVAGESSYRYIDVTRVEVIES